MTQNSENQQTTEIEKLRDALDYVWNQNKIKSEELHRLSDESQELLAKQESENTSTVKSLEKQITSLAYDLNASVKKDKKLKEKWKQSKKDSRSTFKRYKITLSLTLLFFATSAYFVWDSYLAKLEVKSNNRKISKLEIDNGILYLKSEKFRRDEAMAKDKLKNDFNAKIKSLEQKYDISKSKQNKLEEQLIFNLDEFKNSISDLRNEHTFKINLMKNDYTNTIKLLTAEVSVAKEIIQQLQIQGSDLMENPEISLDLDSDDAIYFNKPMAPNEDEKSEIKTKEVTNDEDLLPPLFKDQFKINLKQKL